MKKVLILSAPNSYSVAGRAIANGIANRYPNVAFRLVDVYKGRQQVDFQRVGKDILPKKLAKKLEQDRYTKENLRDNYELLRNVAEPYISGVREYIEYNIKTYEPDVIICTHVLPAVVVSDMEKSGLLKRVRSAYLECNYVVNPFVRLANYIDYYFCATKDMIKNFKHFGVKEVDRVKDSGIPIISSIENIMSKSEARELLALPKNNYTVLITNYTGKSDKTLQLLKSIVRKYSNINVIVICNKNVKLKNKIMSYASTNNLSGVKAYTHTNNLGIILSASDCVMGKTGGMEVAVAIAKHLPYIVTYKINGIELENLKYLKNKNLVINTKTTIGAINALDKLINDYKFRNKCIKAQEYAYRHNATDEIVKFLYHKHKEIEEN